MMIMIMVVVVVVMVGNGATAANAGGDGGGQHVGNMLEDTILCMAAGTDKSLCWWHTRTKSRRLRSGIVRPVGL
eukprot:3216871-Rhodomonas_salina.1